MPDNEQKAVPATNAATSSGPSTRPGTAVGPLVVSETNPRYFTLAAGDAADGRAVYLTGSHVNNNFGDGSGVPAPIAPGPPSRTTSALTSGSSRSAGTTLSGCGAGSLRAF